MLLNVNTLTICLYIQTYKGLCGWMNQLVFLLPISSTFHLLLFSLPHFLHPVFFLSTNVQNIFHRGFPPLLPPPLTFTLLPIHKHTCQPSLLTSSSSLSVSSFFSYSFFPILLLLFLKHNSLTISALCLLLLFPPLLLLLLLHSPPLPLLILPIYKQVHLNPFNSSSHYSSSQIPSFIFFFARSKSPPLRDFQLTRQLLLLLLPCLTYLPFSIILLPLSAQIS